MRAKRADLGGSARKCVKQGAGFAADKPVMELLDLPSDCLCLLLRHVFSGPSSLSGQPLKAVISQWLALRISCKRLASILLNTPLCVDVEAGSPAALRWLANSHVQILRLGRFGSVRDRRRSKSAPALGQQAVEHQREEQGVMQLLESFLRMLEGARFSQLQVLHLKGELCPGGEPASFTTCPLAALPSLRHLHLERFTHFDLAWLPPALRTLRLRYQEAPMFSSEKHPALDIVRLPPHTRLTLLEVDSRAALGLLCCELLRQCEAVVVRATRAYLGVCGPCERGIEVRAFHFPPPDGWLRAKMGAMEAAAGQFLGLLAGGSGRSDGDGSVGGGNAAVQSAAAQWQQHRLDASGGCSSSSGTAAAISTTSSSGGSNRGRASISEGTGSCCCACPPPPEERRLQSIEFHWMCADTLVFVPLEGCSRGAEGGGCGGHQGSSALESAQAAVHEGEDPVVEITAARLAELAGQQAQHGGAACDVHAERGAGHQRAMLLRLARLQGC